MGDESDPKKTCCFKVKDAGIHAGSIVLLNQAYVKHITDPCTALQRCPVASERPPTWPPIPPDDDAGGWSTNSLRPDTVGNPVVSRPLGQAVNVDVFDALEARGLVWDLEMPSQVGPAVSRLLSRNHSCQRQFLARQGCRTLQKGYIGFETWWDSDSADGRR